MKNVMLNFLSLSSPKGILCLLILLSSFAAFGQSEVKVQNKTDCEMTVTVYWTNGSQVQAQQPVTVSPVSIQTIVGPTGVDFCRVEADFPGGINPEIRYGSGATPLSECSSAQSQPNICYALDVFDGSTLYVAP